MDLTSITNASNAGLAPEIINSGRSNSAFANLHSQLFGTWSGSMAVDTPGAGDANQNGFPDFFEVAQPVAAITSPGEYQFDSPFNSGPFTASWSRDAGTDRS